MSNTGLVGKKVIAEFGDLDGNVYLVAQKDEEMPQCYVAYREKDMHRGSDGSDLLVAHFGDMWTVSRKLEEVRRNVAERVKKMESLCRGDFPQPKGINPYVANGDAGWCSMCKVMHGETDRCPY